jgi:hypothetical protein
LAIDAASFAHGKSRGAAIGADALGAAACALFLLTFHAIGGFPTLDASGNDNDSLLRLVQIRDLIGGQGWFDLHQYRMGPDGGFVMHWSRLVDAPIAAIMLAVAAMSGSMVLGETVALIAWPLALLAAAMFFLIRIGRAVGGDWAMLPMLVVGAAALHFIGIFVPGNIDHHNVQLVLSLAAIAALSAPEAGARQGAAAGACAALMLAVGMETLPYVAVAGLYVAARFLVAGRAKAALATGFGAAFAGVAAVAFLATIPGSDWLSAQCDAYSIPQFAIAAIAGAGLAVAAGMEPVRRRFAMRVIALAGIGMAAAAIAAIFFPQCLAAPYSTLDPRLKTFVLDGVVEAQPIWKVLKYNPAMAAGYYVTPVLGLFLLAWKMRRGGLAQPAIVVLAFLAAAIGVSIWQVRGSTFAIPLATIPLCAWVGEWRARVAAGGGSPATLKMALAWVVSLNVAWSASANAIAGAVGAPLSPGGAEASAGTCDRASDFAALAALPATTVLAISNLGTPILSHTHHRVLAGPYHRNVAGDVLALQAFMGSEAEAAAIVEQNGVELVAMCRGNSETAMLSEAAPAGFITALAGGAVPAWLERLPGAVGEPLDIYRLRKQF